MEVPIEFESSSSTTKQPTTTSTVSLNLDEQSTTTTTSMIMDILPATVTAEQQQQQPESLPNEQIIIDTIVTDNNNQVDQSSSSSSIKDLAVEQLSNTIEIPPAIMLDYGETLTFTGEYMESDDGQIIATFQNENGEKTEVIVQRTNVPIENTANELLIQSNDQQQQLETINTLNVVLDQQQQQSSTTAITEQLPLNNHSETIVVIDQNPIDNIAKQQPIDFQQASISLVAVPTSEIKSIVEQEEETKKSQENHEREMKKDSNQNEQQITISTAKVPTTTAELVSDKKISADLFGKLKSTTTTIENNGKQDLKNIINNQNNNKIAAFQLSSSSQSINPIKSSTINSKSIESQQTTNKTKMQTNLFNKLKKSTNDNPPTFNQTNQLSKSLKTYSRSNIVWLNIPAEHNKEQTPATIEENNKLTTTIEIVEDNNNNMDNDIGSTKMWYPRTITKTNQDKLPTSLSSTAKFNQIQTTNKISGEIIMNKNKISDTVKIMMNNNSKGIISINSNNKTLEILKKSGSIELAKNLDNNNKDKKESAVRTQTRSLKSQLVNQKEKQPEQSSSSTSSIPLQQPKKRVSFRNIPSSPVNNLPKDVDIPMVSDDNTQKSISDTKSNTKPIAATICTPITNEDSNVVDVVDFKRKDRRSTNDCCDYRIGKKQQLKISIRIQPECRDEPLSSAMICDICDYRTQIVDAFHSHKNWCCKRFRSNQKHHITNNNNQSPTKTIVRNNSSPSSLTKNNNESVNRQSSNQNTGSRLLRKRKAAEIDDNNKDELEGKKVNLNGGGDGVIHNENNNSIDDNGSINHDQSVNNDEMDKKEENNEENIEEEEDDEEEDDEESKKLDGFSIKDIVWVEVKKRSGLWPALIIDISINERKLILKAIDYNGKNTSFKATTKSVVSHDRSVVNKFLKNHPNESRTVQKVEHYLRKRALEDEINPMEFFFESNSMKQNSMNKSNEISTTNSGSGGGGSINKNSSMSIDGTIIYQFIKEGSVDSYLRSIHQGRIQNSRHKKFLEKQQPEQQNENNIGSEEEQLHFGPIKDEEQRDELFSHLSKLYEDCLKKNKQEKSDEMIGRYIYSVWIPEAIIKAISKKYQIDLKKAGQLFDDECQTLKQNCNSLND